MKYTFIQSSDTEGYPRPIFAISQEIEELELHDTYDRFGQGVGHENAGDYSLHNQYSSAEIDCILEIEKKFGISDVEIEAVFDGFEITKFDGVFCGDYEKFVEGDEKHIEILQKINEINNFILDWEKSNANYSTVKGFNYWNGNNFNSIIVEDEIFDRPTHLIIDDTDSLIEALENKVWVEDRFAKKLFESENYYIIKSFYPISFASYELYPKEFNIEEILN